MAYHYNQDKRISAEHYTQTERTRTITPIYSAGVACPICNYPVSVTRAGEEVHCPYCSAPLIAQAVTIPTWLLAGVVGLGIGVLFGPSILSSTEAGSQWLARQARERIK